MDPDGMFWTELIEARFGAGEAGTGPTVIAWATGPGRATAVPRVFRVAEQNQDRERVCLSELAKESNQMAERISGVMAKSVVRLFARGEAFDSAGFVSFFTDKPVYQFGNGEPCLDKPAIQERVGDGVLRGRGTPLPATSRR